MNKRLDFGFVLRGTVLPFVAISIAVRCWLYAARGYPLAWDANQAYFAAARRVLHGFDLYAPSVGYLYPPTLALLLAPLTLLPAGLWLWMGGITLATLALVPALAPFTGWRWATVLVLLFPATWGSLRMGQINAVIALLCLLALRDPRRRSIWLALGALLKVTPGLGLLVLLLRRSWRDVVLASVVSGAVVMLSLPVVGLQSWIDGLTATTSAVRIAQEHGVSLVAVLSRFTSPLVAGGTALILLLVTLWRARSLSDHQALAAAMVVPLLIAPVVWRETVILLLPALAVLWTQRTTGRWVAIGAWLTIGLASVAWIPVAVLAVWCACISHTLPHAIPVWGESATG